MEFKFEYIFFVVFACVIGSFIFKIIKHGGFKAAMFGAGIKNTIGEVSGNGPKIMNLSLRVHELDGSPEKAVGLELVAKSVGSYQMTPITLSISEAKKLIDLLNSITHGK
jgi:hypothetical protein